jgi:hypothetical protein
MINKLLTAFVCVGTVVSWAFAITFLSSNTTLFSAVWGGASLGLALLFTKQWVNQ